MATLSPLFLIFHLLLWILAPLHTRAWDNGTSLMENGTSLMDNDTSLIYPDDKNATVLEISDKTYGVRNVSYWVTDDSLAVIDGDVIYGTLENLLAHNHTGQTSTNITRRAHSIFSNENPWPSATVTYNYDSDDTQKLLSPIVNQAITSWKAAAPYLTFKLIANSASGQNGVLTIKNPRCGGCNSQVGFFNEPMTLNLQQVSCKKTSPVTCKVVAATHELGHALGLIHEHQRRDRESFVHYNCANLNPLCPDGTSMPAGKTCCSSDIPSGCCGLAHNFDILDGIDDDATGSYDIKSIMQYRANGFAIPGTNTLTSNAPGIVVPVSNPSAISPTDAARICKIYSGQCPKAQECMAARCPTPCRAVRRCPKAGLCGGRIRPLPPCCSPVSPQTCRTQRLSCTKRGCDFLRNV